MEGSKRKRCVYFCMYHNCYVLLSSSKDLLHFEDFEEEGLSVAMGLGIQAT